MWYVHFNFAQSSNQAKQRVMEVCVVSFEGIAPVQQQIHQVVVPNQMATVSSEAQLMMTKCSGCNKNAQKIFKADNIFLVPKARGICPYVSNIKTFVQKMNIIFASDDLNYPHPKFIVIHSSAKPSTPTKNAKGVRKIEVPMHGNILVQHAFR